MKMIFPICAALCFIASAVAQTTAPAGSLANPKEITSADTGPDIDPVKLAASKYNSLKVFNTFRSFMSSDYALANVWIYAAGDDQKFYNSETTYTYPDFYQPTWGEVFDTVARQTRSKWSWNPKNRQFKFEPTKDEPAFGVTLADGWRREDRGAYIWHAPKDQDFGMDIYDYGSFTAGKEDKDLFKKVRAFYAVNNLSNWPNPPTEQQMSVVKIGDNEALFLKIDTPRPGGVWRQWSIVIDGHAYLIVSAMPKDREDELMPAIQKMVESFKVKSAATPPAK